ncbi:MAG: hypothetical protein WAW86_08090 [Gammaproteobacteria bacterium]
MDNRHQFFSSSKSAKKPDWGRAQFVSELGGLLANESYWCQVTESSAVPKEINELKNALLSGSNKSTGIALKRGMQASSPVLQVFFSTLAHHLSLGFDKSSNDLKTYMKTMNDAAKELVENKSPKLR